MGSSHGFDNGTAPRKMTILNGAPICGMKMRPMASSPRIVRICASVCPYTHRRVARRGRIVSPAAVSVANKTLWICRCAWTTLTRRPQLHRAHIGKLLIWIRKRIKRGLARRPYEAAASSVTQCNARLTPIASCEVCGAKTRPNGELPSDHYADRRRETPELRRKAHLAVHRPCACSGVKALRNTSDARRQAAKLC